MELKTKREAVVELVNKLFVYTDAQQWDKLIKDVFKEYVNFDMSSMGAGEARELTAIQICQLWRDGFKGIDQIHHQAGNYIVDFENESVEARVFCYATATHYKASPKNGTTRTFVGSYELHVAFTDKGWRIDAFRYNFKYSSGNLELN